MFNIKNYVVLDIETTGLEPEQGDKIVSIGLLKIKNGKIQDKFYSLVNPGVEIPVDAIEIHKITNEQVQDKPYLEDIKDKILDFIGNDFVIGHNIAEFDRFFLLDIIWLEDFRVIDTLLLSRELQKELGICDNKLRTICEQILKKQYRGHNALTDCQYVFEFFEIIKNKYYNPDIAWKQYTYFLFDFITTGKDPEKHEFLGLDIWKIANGKIQDKFAKRFTPTKTIPLKMREKFNITSMGFGDSVKITKKEIYEIQKFIDNSYILTFCEKELTKWLLFLGQKYQVKFNNHISGLKQIHKQVFDEKFDFQIYDWDPSATWTNKYLRKSFNQNFCINTIFDFIHCQNFDDLKMLKYQGIAYQHARKGEDYDDYDFYQCGNIENDVSCLEVTFAQDYEFHNHPYKWLEAKRMSNQFDQNLNKETILKNPIKHEWNNSDIEGKTEIIGQAIAGFIFIVFSFFLLLSWIIPF